MIRIAMSAAAVLAMTLTLAACDARRDADPPAMSPVPAAAVPSGLVRVTDASQVCMVNDQYMGKPQIPVEVAGKTYYGCCAMCKEKLEKLDTARLAVDPVSGKRVDKASAVIGRNPGGKVFYFESEATLAQYKP